MCRTTRTIGYDDAMWRLALGGLGLCLFVWGVRGRRVGREPRCAECSYDLSGFDVGAAGAQCPECGLVLLSGVRVRCGRLRRPPAVAGLGVAILLLWLAPVALQQFNQVSKPVWLLRREAMSGFRDVAERAQTELISRMKAKALSQAQMQRLAAQALSVQADTAAPMRLWGDAYEVALAAGATTPEQDAKFLRQLLSFKLMARPVVGVGDPLPFDIQAFWRGPTRSTTPGVPSGGDLSNGLQLTIRSLRLDNVELPWLETPLHYAVFHGNLAASLLWNAQSVYPQSPFPLAHLPQGSYEFVAECSVKWRDDFAAVLGISPALRWDPIVTTTVTVVEQSPPIEMTQGGAELPKFKVDTFAIRLDSCYVRVGMAPGQSIGDMPYAFEVELVGVNGTSEPLGGLAFSPGAGTIGCGRSVAWDVLERLDPARTGKITVCLTPSQQVARRTLHLDRIVECEPITLTLHVPERPARRR